LEIRSGVVADNDGHGDEEATVEEGGVSMTRCAVGEDEDPSERLPLLAIVDVTP